MLADGNATEALAHAQVAVKAAPESPAAHYLMGLVQASQRDLSAATTSFNEVLRLNPRVAAAQVQLVRLQLAQGASKEAVQLAESALKSAPKSAEGRLALAGGLIAQKDYARAEPIVATLLKEYPKTATVHALQGMLQLTKGAVPEARAAFERALELDQASYAAINGLTVLDMLEKKAPAARARVEARLAATPDNVPLLLLASRVFVATNDPAKAEQSLRRVIELAPADSTAYSMLGQLYISQKKLTEAQAEFDVVAKRNPRNVGARTLSAVIAQMSNSLEDAKKRYREILELDPAAVVAGNNLAWIYAEEGRDLDEALRLAQQAARQAPDNADIKDTIGWIYYRKELPLLALPLFEENVTKVPGNPTYHYHLGLAHAKNGNVEEARRAVASALKLKPDYREAREFQASLR